MPIKLTTEQFIKQAKDAHGDKYAYDLVEYKNSRTKVKILCPIHGGYEQTPSNHLEGRGCPHCAYESKAKALLAKAKSEFVSKSQETHGDKYTYELVNYVNSQTKVKIVCRCHGSYLQTPANHLSGKGCPVCSNEASGFTRTKFKDKCDKNNNGLGILYVLECFNDNEHFFKIGITSNSIKKRYHNKTLMPYNYRVIDEITGDPSYIFDLETKMHQQHKEQQYSPTIPFAGSSTECFKQYLTNIKL